MLHCPSASLPLAFNWNGGHDHVQRSELSCLLSHLLQRVIDERDDLFGGRIAFFIETQANIELDRA